MIYWVVSLRGFGDGAETEFEGGSGIPLIPRLE